MKDVQPILASDCVSCHGGSRTESGVNLSTYAGALSEVSIGSASSKLIQVTQPGGLMYSRLTGDRTAKARTIYDWIMTSNAAQQNTALKWLPKDARFQCPKHDSRYQPDGTFVSGHATRSMDRFAIRREGDALVVDAARWFQSDRQPAEWAAARVDL